MTRNYSKQRITSVRYSGEKLYNQLDKGVCVKLSAGLITI